MSEEIEAEAQESLLPEGVEDDLKRKHGSLITFEVGGQPYAFHRASQSVHDRFLNTVVDTKEKAQAQRTFVVSCLAYPTDAQDKPDYKSARSLFEMMPTAVGELFEAIQELPGKLDLKKR